MSGRATEIFGQPARLSPFSSSSGHGFLFVSLHEHPGTRGTLTVKTCILLPTKDFLSDDNHKKPFCCGFSGIRTSHWYLSYVFVDSRNWNSTKTHGWLVGDSVVEGWWGRRWNMRRSSPTSSCSSSKGVVVVCMKCRYVFSLGQSTIVSLSQRIEGSDRMLGNISFEINFTRFAHNFHLKYRFKSSK